MYAPSLRIPCECFLRASLLDSRLNSSHLDTDCCDQLPSLVPLLEVKPLASPLRSLPSRLTSLPTSILSRATHFMAPMLTRLTNPLCSSNTAPQTQLFERLRLSSAVSAQSLSISQPASTTVSPPILKQSPMQPSYLWVRRGTLTSNFLGS